MTSVIAAPSLIWLYLRNLALLANYATMALVGQDPRKTISAFSYAKNIRWLQWLANALYRDPDHCKDAAAGWVDENRQLTEWARLNDRSLW